MTLTSLEFGACLVALLIIWVIICILFDNKWGRMNDVELTWDTKGVENEKKI